MTAAEHAERPDASDAAAVRLRAYDRSITFGAEPIAFRLPAIARHPRVDSELVVF